MSQRIYERSNLMINTQSPNEPTPKCDLEPEQNVILSPRPIHIWYEPISKAIKWHISGWQSCNLFFFVCVLGHWSSSSLVMSETQNLATTT